MTAYLLPPTTRIDLIVLLNPYRHVPEISEALAMLRAMKPQTPDAWRTFDGEGDYEYRTHDNNENYAAEWNERNPNHVGWVKPLYTLGDDE